MKERLKKEYKTLRMCSVRTRINYYRLSQIVNGYVRPHKCEMQALKITPEELKKTLKVD